VKNNHIPEIRFAGYTENWEQRNWEDTVDISTNMVDPKTGSYDELPHIGPGNIESFTGKILDNVLKVKDSNLISGKFHFYRGDIIYGKINPQLGKYAIAPFEGLGSADSYILNTKNGVVQNFLYSVLQTKDFYTYSVSVSARTGMPKINRDELNVYSYKAPKTEEQTKVGKFFVELEHLIALRQKELTILKQTKQGFLQKMFPTEGESVPKVRFSGFTREWKLSKLSDFLSSLKSGLSRMLSNEDIGLPVIRANNINNGILDIDNNIKYWYVDDPQGANTQNYLIHKNDILVNFINSEAKMGTAAIVGSEPKRPTIYTTNILNLRTNQDASPYFIYSLTMTEKYKNYIKTITKPAVNQASFTTVDFKKYEFFAPTIQEQIKIGDFFKQLDDTITLHQCELDALKETKKAFLQKMFV